MEFDLTAAKAANRRVRKQVRDFDDKQETYGHDLYVYVLTEPGDDSIRYVGEASNPEDRYRSHIAIAKRGPRLGKNFLSVSAWIRSLLEESKAPDMHVVSRISSRAFCSHLLSAAVMQSAVEKVLIDKLARGHWIGNSIPKASLLNVAFVPKKFSE